MKAPLFPRDTVHWPVVEHGPVRALTRSALEMGVLAGILLRAFRAYALTHGVSGSGAWLGATFALGAVVLCGMLALHLANFPVRRWPGHVARFLVAEVAAELAVSMLLVAAGREPLGTTGRATWADLPTMATTTLAVRFVSLAAFAAALAGIVQLVRIVLARRGPHHLHAPGTHDRS